MFRLWRKYRMFCNVATRWVLQAYDTAKNATADGALPRTLLGELTALPRTLAGFKGPLRGEGRKGAMRWGKGRGGSLNRATDGLRPALFVLHVFNN